MNRFLRSLAPLTVAAALAGCAGQASQPGSLFDGSSSSLIDVEGQNAMARPWTSAGLPDDDNRAFVLAVNPEAAAGSTTVKLAAGNSGVISYGAADAKGCKSVDMLADFRDRDGRVHQGERVSTILCPPALFGSWTTRSVTEIAQAKIVVPPRRVAVAPPPPARKATAARSARNGKAPQSPVPVAVADPPKASPAEPITAAMPTLPTPEPAPASPTPASPAPAPVAHAPAPASPPAKADSAPWKPAIQTDL